MQIGSQVIYVPGVYDKTQMDLIGERLAAIVAHVHEDGRANVVVFDSRCTMHMRTGVATGSPGMPGEGHIEVAV